jgi:hypothetical protein
MSTFRTVRDSLLKREAAEPILAPHFDKIQKCCLQGMASWLEFACAMPHLRLALLPRTMANFVNDWVVQHARGEFPLDKAKGVEPFDGLGFFCIGFDRKLILHFKKSDDADLTKNIPTKQQQEIQEHQRVIDGWEQVTWVSACYRLTPTADSIDRVVITCRWKSATLWHIPIYDARTEAEVGLIPFPEPQEPQQRKSRVRPKGLTTPEGGS